MSSPVGGPSIDRRPGLDRLRVGVMLAVLVFHAAVPYIAHPLPGLTWPTRHPAPSVSLDVLSWALAVLVMPLFFWLSGYGSAGALSRLGGRAFLESRWRRIGRPGLLFAVVLLPIEVHLWVAGWVVDGFLPPTKLRSLKLGVFHAGLWGPSNLWYLQYLIVYCAFMAVWHRSVRPRGLRIWDESAKPSLVAGLSDRLAVWEGRLARCWNSRWGSLLLALPTIGLLTLHPAILLGFEHSSWPEPQKLLFLGLFFAAGVASHRCDDRFFASARVSRSLRTFGTGAVLLLVAAPMLGTYLTHPSAVLIHPRLTANPDPVQFSWMFRIGLATLIAGGISQIIWGLAASALADSRPASPALKDWSRASYWIYFIHHPLVAACHVALCRSSLGAMAQFLLTTVITLGLSWGSYRILVRHTRLGAFLDGSGARRMAASTIPTVSRKAA